MPPPRTLLHVLTAAETRSVLWVWPGVVPGSFDSDRFDPLHTHQGCKRAQTCLAEPNDTAQILRWLLLTPHNLQYHFLSWHLSSSSSVAVLSSFLPPSIPIAISYFLPEFINAGLNGGSESLAVHPNLAKSRQRADET